MKKNNSFRYTFYLGLTVIFFTVLVLTLLFINLYYVMSPLFEIEDNSNYIENVKIEKEITRDTNYDVSNSNKIKPNLLQNEKSIETTKTIKVVNSKPILPIINKKIV